MMIPIPTPAPMPMNTIVETPRASPNDFSPRAARLMLLSMRTGTSKREPTALSGSKRAVGGHVVGEADPAGLAVHHAWRRDGDGE